MSAATVEFRNVCFERGARGILRQFNLAAAPGETVVLLGRSGSGKTTALKMVNRLLDPSSGIVAIDGHSVSDQDPVALRRRTGYVIQEVGLFPHFTVERNIGLVPALEGWPADAIAARVRELLEAVGLPYDEFAARLPRELSGGQRQRVGVARALAARPSVLLFDEPFGALDPLTRRDLQQQFLTLRGALNATALFVTHDVREALLVASRIALLHEGTLAFLGTPAEFRGSTAPAAQAFLACLES